MLLFVKDGRVGNISEQGDSDFVILLSPVLALNAAVKKRNSFKTLSFILTVFYII